MGGKELFKMNKGGMHGVPILVCDLNVWIFKYDYHTVEVNVIFFYQ